MERLKEILSLKRGHGSVGERKFLENILSLYLPRKLCDQKGEIGAYEVTVGDGTSTILWSCHIDTVHAATEDAKQHVLWDKEGGMAYKQDGKPLGADDGAGVWLLLEMIDAGVPGTYMFHRGEEKGCIGSGIVSTHHMTPGAYTHAIAFDRRDTCSVITHQMGQRCASEKFANQICELMNDGWYELKPDSTGSFTDTAEYTKQIDECTNISVGYYNEHSKDEILDLDYLTWLRDKMIEVFKNPPELVVDRDRTEVEYDHYDFYPDTKAWGKDFRDEAFRDYGKRDTINPKDEYDIVDMRWRDIVNWVRRAEPETVADLISEFAEVIVYDMPKYKARKQ